MSNSPLDERDTNHNVHRLYHSRSNPDIILSHRIQEKMFFPKSQEALYGVRLVVANDVNVVRSFAELLGSGQWRAQPLRLDTIRRYARNAVHMAGAGR